MTTVVFLLQKGQFSAVIGDKKCNLRGGESMSFVEFDSEKIVESFENSDYFKGWNDVQLFILYDSESAEYLFNIIDGFELKNKVESCENFSFQIKLEEKPIDLNGNIAAILEKGDSAAASEIGKLKNEIDDLKKEIDQKSIENEELNRKIVEKDNEISRLDKRVQTLKNEIAPKDKKIEELKKWYDEWDCFAEANIIDDRENTGIIELKKPVGDIHKIYMSQSEITYSDADKQLKTMNMGRMQWHFPTEEECEILFELYKIPKVDKYDWKYCDFTRVYSLFFKGIDEWFIGDGKNSYRVYYNNCLVDDKNNRINKIGDGYKSSVLFVR